MSCIRPFLGSSFGFWTTVAKSSLTRRGRYLPLASVFFCWVKRRPSNTTETGLRQGEAQGSRLQPPRPASVRKGNAHPIRVFLLRLGRTRHGTAAPRFPRKCADGYQP